MCEEANNCTKIGVSLFMVKVNNGTARDMGRL
jgi:hypothetical protein